MTASAATDVTLRIGGLFVTNRESVVRTVLGSCISACLYDPVARVGGMNHFMLPALDDAGTSHEPLRFGEHAMEVLIGSIQRLGGQRDRLHAKVFGGGHVLNTAPSALSVPARNIAFIERFIREENLLLISQDLGGFLARRVHFYPHTGKAMVKRLGTHALHELQLEEEQARRLPCVDLVGDITLF